MNYSQMFFWGDSASGTDRKKCIKGQIRPIKKVLRIIMFIYGVYNDVFSIYFILRLVSSGNYVQLF